MLTIYNKKDNFPFYQIYCSYVPYKKTHDSLKKSDLKFFQIPRGAFLSNGSDLDLLYSLKSLQCEIAFYFFLKNNCFRVGVDVARSIVFGFGVAIYYKSFLANNANAFSLDSESVFAGRFLLSELIPIGDFVINSHIIQFNVNHRLNKCFLLSDFIDPFYVLSVLSFIFEIRFGDILMMIPSGNTYSVSDGDFIEAVLSGFINVSSRVKFS